MAPYRRGGRGRGDHRLPYDGGSGFVWPPPACTPLVPAPHRHVPPMGYHPSPMVLPPHQAAHGPPVAVYWAPTPAGPRVSFSPPAAPVTNRRAPPSSPSASPSSSPAPPSSPSASPSTPVKAPPRSTSASRALASAPRQKARGASTRASEPTPPSSAALLAKEVVSETALTPALAVAASAQGRAASEAEAASEDADLATVVPKKGLAHPARPGAATVRASHLVDVNNPFHYDVSINPESKSRQTNQEVLTNTHAKTALDGKLPAYDGRKSLYTAGALSIESEEFAVMLDPEKMGKERAESEYKITIRIAGRTDLYHLQQFLHGRQRDMPQETIQMLDVVVRESPFWNYVTVSRSFFSAAFGHKGHIGEGLECWRGHYQSLHPTQMGFSLNIDISATSFFKPVSVIEFVEEFLMMCDTSRPLSDRDCVKIKALRGVHIETTHQQDQIRRYKITGITSVSMNQLAFPVDDKGTRQTFVQYFWNKYNCSLKYGSWPCLRTGSDSHPVYLPMEEVCKIVEGQRYSKKLNDKQVTNILRATCKHPQEREQSIHDVVLHNKNAWDRFAQEFGISVSSDLVTVPARVLLPTLLRCHDSGWEKTCALSVGQWNMINKDRSDQKTVINSNASVVEKIEVDVDILGTHVQLNILRNSRVEDAVYDAMNQLQLRISDFYVTSPHHVVQMESMIGNFYKLVVTPRLRGGNDEPSASGIHKVNLNSWIVELKNKEDNKWFEKVIIPRALLRVEKSEDWIVVLGSNALLVLCLIFDLLERVHSSEHCYEGRFNLEDIYFIPVYGILVMDEKVRRRILCHDGYKADLVTVVEKLLRVHFTFAKFDGTRHFPAYIRSLVTVIQKLEKKDVWCFSQKRRSLIYNNPATWSSAKKVNIFTLLNQYFKRLPQVQRRILMGVLSQQPDFDWHSKVTDRGAAQALKEVFFNAFWDGSSFRQKTYRSNLMGRVDFTRCVIIHAMDSQVSLVAVDAAMYVIWPEPFQELHALFTVDYTPKSNRRLSNKGKSLAIEYREDILPIKEDLEVYEIFGLPGEPKN